MQIQDTTAIPYIEIQHLVVSEHNVRKTASSAASIKALAANLKATNGPVQNLVVTPGRRRAPLPLRQGNAADRRCACWSRAANSPRTTRCPAP